MPQPLPLIAANHARFGRMVAAALAATSPSTQAALCAQAAIFAVRNPCGIFNSKQLEDCLTNLAATIPTPPTAGHTPHTFLHVFSRAYTSGGHTRVAERWINAAPATGTHDVVLLSQGTRPVPATLEAAARGKQGRLIHLPHGLPLAKAARLRALASTYQHVILHVHMYDIIPILAFGTSTFTRPVTLYNHADHLFWLGASVADCIVNFRSLSATVNTSFRHIQPARNRHLPLPVNQPLAPLPQNTRRQLKASLGLPEDAQVILTMASPFKYAPIENLDFLATAEAILAQNPRAVLLAIGPSMQQNAWRNAHHRTGGRIKPLGRIPHTGIDPFLALADLALDSFPFSSLTALLDIARHNIPCLTLNSPVNGYDAFTQAGITCNSQPELILRATQQLANPSPNKLLPLITAQSFPAGFATHIAALHASLPPNHAVHPVRPDTHAIPTAMEVFIARNHLSNARTLRHHAMQAIQTFVYHFIRLASPRLIPAPLYRRLEGYGML